MGHSDAGRRGAAVAAAPTPAVRQPILRTLRLTLRPFTEQDAPVVEKLAGAREVADTTLRIPHPYPEGVAAAWIAGHALEWSGGTGVVYAITDGSLGTIYGAIGLTIDAEHALGELGYWLAAEYWNRGYCTEAGDAVLALAFGALGLHRVQARHFTRNPASGRVMQKLGMRREGIHRHATRKWGQFEDVAMYALLEPEWRGRSGTAGVRPSVGVPGSAVGDNRKG